MDKEKLKPFCVDLMEKSKAAYLTTIDKDGFPFTRAMLNLRNTEQYPSLTDLFKNHRNDMLIYLTTNTQSEKIAQIKQNPKISLYYSLPEIFHGVMFSGVVEIIQDPDIKKSLWQDGWEMYYPIGYDDPDHTVLRLIPQLARGWHGTGPFEFNFGNTG